MYGAVAKDVCFHQTVDDKIVVHPTKVICEIIDNLVQHQSLAILRRTAAAACRRIRQLEHCRIMTCIADHIEIRVAECMREQLTLGIPAVEEQDDLAFFKDWYDFIEKLAGKRQLRGFAVAHDVANRYRDITNLLLACVLMEDRHAHRQADKGMAIEIGLAIVFGVVVQDAYTVEVPAPLGNGRVVHAEQDKFLPQCIWHYGKRLQRQSLANGCICDEAVAKGTVIAVERCVRLRR